MFIYYVYDDKNNLVFKGTKRQVCSKFKISYNSLYSYYGEGSKINKIYRVVKGEEIIPETKEDKLIKYYTSHLDIYGNVYSKENPEPYLSKLKKLGYHCKIDTYNVLDDTEIIVSESSKVHRKKKRNYRTDYVITRLK